jgi:hypothetical protein
MVPNNVALWASLGERVSKDGQGMTASGRASAETAGACDVRGACENLCGKLQRERDIHQDGLNLMWLQG